MGDALREAREASGHTFSRLKNVRGTLTLATLAADINGFANLETIGGALRMPSNYNLEVVRFDSLRSVGMVEEAWQGPISVEVMGSGRLSEIGFPLLVETPGGVFFDGGAAGTPFTLELALEAVR